MDGFVAGVVAALMALTLGGVPGAAPARVAVERGCYAEGDRIVLAGEGFEPEARLQLALERAGAQLRSSNEPVADDAGRVSGTLGIEDETGWFPGRAWRFHMTLELFDPQRPEDRAETRFWFSRFTVTLRAPGGQLRPRRPADVRATGFTGAAGRALYAHWLRNGVRVHSRRLGVLEGPCGTLRTRLSRAFPFTPRPGGRWRVAFNASPADARAPRTIVVRVPRRVSP
jgi:hypothetical protein